jgi:hypothetical protein
MDPIHPVPKCAFPAQKRSLFVLTEGSTSGCFVSSLLEIAFFNHLQLQYLKILELTPARFLNPCGRRKVTNNVSEKSPKRLSGGAERKLGQDELPPFAAN